MEAKRSFTEGKILGPLLRFTMPVLLALCLQAAYGAVDLMVVGQFGTAADVSAVSTGTQIMHTITAVITGLAMGTTVLIGQKLGQKKDAEAGDVIGGSICLFAVVAVVLTAAMLIAATPFCRLMQAPEEAFDKTVQYVSVCSGGLLFIVAYNVLGSVFRGLGDSKTPLLAVGIACAVNIAGDLLFVAVLKMDAAFGAALATVLAQALSVGLCLLVIRKHGLPFPFSRACVRFSKEIIGGVLKLGAPIALQDILVSISFLAILAIVNSLGLIASAGMGVAEKLCAFIMLVPSAFAQSLSAFVAQNVGAGKPERTVKALRYGIFTSLAIGAVLAYLSFFHGDILASIFAGDDTAVIAAGADYLKAYAVDTVLTPFLFCFIGYFNGWGRTRFVLIQGIVGAFFVRIPVSFLMSRWTPVTLFHIGLATPCSTIVQIVLCGVYMVIMKRHMAKNDAPSWVN